MKNRVNGVVERRTCLFLWTVHKKRGCVRVTDSLAGKGASELFFFSSLQISFKVCRVSPYVAGLKNVDNHEG